MKEYLELFNFDVNTYISRKNKFYQTENIETLLNYAIVRRASTEIFRLLINKSTNVHDINNTHNETIQDLFSNWLKNKYEIMELLLENGCWDINREIGVGYTFTPLYYAVSIFDTELVKFLLSKGADKDKENSRGFTAYQMVTIYIEAFKINPLESANHTLHYNNGLKMRDYMEGRL